MSEINFKLLASNIEINMLAAMVNSEGVNPEKVKMMLEEQLAVRHEEIKVIELLTQKVGT